MAYIVTTYVAHRKDTPKQAAARVYVSTDIRYPDVPVPFMWLSAK